MPSVQSPNGAEKRRRPPEGRGGGEACYQGEREGGGDRGAKKGGGGGGPNRYLADVDMACSDLGQCQPGVFSLAADFIAVSFGLGLVRQREAFSRRMANSTMPAPSRAMAVKHNRTSRRHPAWAPISRSILDLKRFHPSVHGSCQSVNTRTRVPVTSIAVPGSLMPA